MKKVLAGMVACMLLVSFAACSGGVSQEEYDTLLTEYETLQRNYDELQNNYNTLLEALAGVPEPADADEAAETPADDVDDVDDVGDAADEPTMSAGDLTFGSSFEFMEFRLDIGTEIRWDAVSNRFSDLDGAEVVMVPVTITNESSETQSFRYSYFTAFGPDGLQLDNVGSYFSDYDITKTGDLRPDATTDAYFCLVYTGDGEYVIEFSYFGEESCEASFIIEKDGAETEEE